MTTSPTLLQNFATDTWVKATWEEFMALTYNPAYEKGRAYYDRGKLRIEMAPIGLNHDLFGFSRRARSHPCFP